MSLLDLDSWITEFEACQRLSNVISSQITQRDLNQWQTLEYNSKNSTLQTQLKQFDNELEQLKVKLKANAKNRNITAPEAARRQALVDELQREFIDLKYKFSNTYQQNAAPTSSRSLWQGESSGNAAVIDMNDVDLLKKREIEILEQQSRGLDVLADTISRQRELATQLGQEAEGQNEILDNLANTMDGVNTRVQSSTLSVGLVSRQDSTWCYWIIIILLLIANLIVAFI